VVISYWYFFSIIDGHVVHYKKGVDVDFATKNPEGPKKTVRSVETFVMKKHFPLFVEWCAFNDIHVDSRYNSTRNLILRWAAQNAIVISRIQCETVELNAAPHLLEAKRLGLASIPPLPSRPPSVVSVHSVSQHVPTRSSPEVASYSPLSCDEAGETSILPSVLSEDILPPEIEISDDDFM